MTGGKIPPGCAIVQRVGWEEDAEYGHQFTALLVFPNGPPDDLMAGVVWRQEPVRIVVVDD